MVYVLFLNFLKNLSEVSEYGIPQRYNICLGCVLETGKVKLGTYS